MVGSVVAGEMHMKFLKKNNTQGWLQFLVLSLLQNAWVCFKTAHIGGLAASLQCLLPLFQNPHRFLAPSQGSETLLNKHRRFHSLVTPPSDPIEPGLGFTCKSSKCLLKAKFCMTFYVPWKKTKSV